MKLSKNRLMHRDLSWLSFGHRILQEAADRRVPLYERIRFIAIFSANMDEYFTVRVAWIRQLISLKRRVKKRLDFEPVKLLRRVIKVVHAQQEQFATIFENQILKELRRHNIFLVDEAGLTEEQRRFARRYFQEQVEPHLHPVFLSKNKDAPFLENKSLYLALRMVPKAKRRRSRVPGKGRKARCAIVEIPTAHCSRFVMLPEVDGKSYVMFLDDIVRLCLPELFQPYTVNAAYSVKMSRDAELYIDDEFSGNLLEKIRKALSKRHQGVPTRFLYDEQMPKKLLKTLRRTFSLSEDDLVRGGRYHRFNDLFSFPNPKAPLLQYPPLEPLQQLDLNSSPQLFDAIATRDFLLHYPYHSFGYVLRFLKEATNDPAVTSINISLYRVAQDSQVVRNLVEAARNGKAVTAFIEVRARFDEELNLRWAEELEQAGVKVIYSVPGLKVHGKLCLISRKERRGVREYAYLGTGNFNEVTAQSYSDFGFFTSDKRLTGEVAQVFDYLSGGEKKVRYEHLLVAPFNMQGRIIRMIEKEIRNRRKGKKARIIAKMNGLEDPTIIRKLYDAGRAGVDVQLIVRGICCLVPGIKKLSQNIKAISIVDRFLEHGRVYFFYNGGKERCYLSSADWMIRNMIRRIEVAFPIYSETLKKELRACINIQLADNRKARIIDKSQRNEFKKSSSGKRVRTQVDTYLLLKQYQEKIHHLEQRKLAANS